MNPLDELIERQIKHCKDTIGNGENFEPQLVMEKDGAIIISLISSNDPMPPAITLVQMARPTRYTFASETWIAHPVKAEDIPRMLRLSQQRKLGTLPAHERTEGLIVVGAEMGGKQIVRAFNIDRTAKSLIEITEGTFTTRMPREW